jgi:hypothetical protein
MKSFYEFRGNWVYIFDRLVGIITPSNIKKFTVWQSKSGNSRNLLIIYDMKMNSEWEYRNNIHQISESEFLLKYKSRINDHIIHGFNEFGTDQKHALPILLRKIIALF